MTYDSYNFPHFVQCLSIQTFFVILRILLNEQDQSTTNRIIINDNNLNKITVNSTVPNDRRNRTAETVNEDSPWLC